MSETRMKELQEFADNFNQKLKEAYTLYEKKQKKIMDMKNLKKCKSQINTFHKTDGDKIPSKSKNLKKIPKIDTIKYLSNNAGFTTPPVWKPPKFYPTYFDDFKRLHNQYELDDWEKVCKYLIN